MKTIEQIRNQPRLRILEEGLDGGNAWAYLASSRKPHPAAIVFSWGGGWEHVSISFSNRTPTWDEMQEAKRMFWKDDETVIQFHPAESEYVNNYPYCLHLWKKKGEQPEFPPWWMVGIKPGKTRREAAVEAAEYFKARGETA